MRACIHVRACVLTICDINTMLLMMVCFALGKYSTDFIAIMEKY